MRKAWVFVLLSAVTFAQATDTTDTVERNGKILPIFQVVRFPNDVCTGSTRNGTCYTAEECSNKQGTNEGTCASGFGVCCVITLACGGSSSNNNTYIVQTATTTPPATPCQYSICPCSTDICRIRYDFTAHTLASQQIGTPAAGGSLTDNSAIGDCADDQFSIASPGAWGSPVICGTNTGQHMILDSDGSNCQTATFNIGASTSTSRSWDIVVTQYTCGQEDEAGAPGCLQYFTGTTATFKNFGYPTTNTAAATAETTTHLSNQKYSICVRREAGYCYICYAPWNSIDASASFGLSNAAADMDHSNQGTGCRLDYITIPDGEAIAAAMTTTVAAAVSRFCGRYINPTTAQATSIAVCSRVFPFRVGVTTDSSENCSIAAGNTCESDVATANDPAGILGFAITYTQGTC